jgi:predicted PurR-regulated permease PerM
MLRKVQHNVVRILYVLVSCCLSLYLISPFLAPIIFGGSIALSLFPLLLKLESKGLTRNKAAALLTTAFALVVSVPFFFFVVKGTMAVTEQLQKFSTDLRYKDKGIKSIVNTVKHDIILKVQDLGERFGLHRILTEEKLDTYLARANTILLDFFQVLATNLPEIFLFFLVTVICTYAFLKNADGVKRATQNTFGFEDEKMDQLVHIFINDSRSVYVANIATGALQSLIIAVAATMLHIGDFFLIFFVTVIFSFIPVVGAAPVAFLLALASFIQGDTTQAIVMVIVGSISGVADNVLRPFIASKGGESSIPAIAAFVFVIGGALLLGFPGLFIGLLVGSFAWDTLPLFWEELGRDRSHQYE